MKKLYAIFSTFGDAKAYTNAENEEDALLQIKKHLGDTSFDRYFKGKKVERVKNDLVICIKEAPLDYDGMGL